MAGALELSASRLEAAMKKILQGTIMNVLEINEKIKSLSKEIKDIKKKPHENLEDRNTSAKKKTQKTKSVYGFNSRLEWREEGVSVLANRKIEITQIEQQRGVVWGWGKSTTSKTCGTRSSVVVQWLRVCLSVQGTQVRTLVGELGSYCCGAVEPTAITEPTSPGAGVPQPERSMCTTTKHPAHGNEDLIQLKRKQNKHPWDPKKKKVYALTSLKSLKKTEGTALKVLEKK